MTVDVLDASGSAKRSVVVEIEESQLVFSTRIEVDVVRELVRVALVERQAEPQLHRPPIFFPLAAGHDRLELTTRKRLGAFVGLDDDLLGRDHRASCGRDAVVEHVGVDYWGVDVRDIGEVDVQHVELVAVELEIVVAHALHLALEPFTRNHPHPIEGVAEVDDIARTDAGGFLLLDPGHARLDCIDGRVGVRGFGWNTAGRGKQCFDCLLTGELRGCRFRRRWGSLLRGSLFGSRMLWINVKQRDGQQGGPHYAATKIAVYRMARRCGKGRQANLLPFTQAGDARAALR